MLKKLVILSAAALPAAFAGAARGPVPVPVPVPVPATSVRTDAPRPFGVGERLEYSVSFGKLHVGSGHMWVVGIDTIENHPVWHAVLAVSGGVPFFHVHDTTSSWFDTTAIVSRRFVQHLNDGPYHVHRDFRIEPEEQRYTKNNEPTTKSSPDPLDDVSMIYYVRTLPLATGDRYELHRYFQPDGNPVVIKVLRRERVTVPAGSFPAIVVEPTIKTSGIFSQNGHAELWFSDDSSRVLLQMKASLSFGSLNLYLKRATRGGDVTAP